MKTEIRAEQVKIIDFKPTKVAALEYRGSPALIGDSLRKFIEWRKKNEMPPRVSATFNIVYHHSVEPDGGDCRYDFCAATERDIVANGLGVVAKIIPGGRCAVLRHIGSDDNLGMITTYLYSEWLPQSGEELRDFPLYFQRVIFFPDVSESEAVTDVFLPLK